MIGGPFSPLLFALNCFRSPHLQADAKDEIPAQNNHQQQRKENNKMNAVLNTAQTERMTLYYREDSSDKPPHQ